MAIARSVFAMLGTSESSGSTIGDNVASSDLEVDVLADDLSYGFVNIYLVFTSTVAVGSVDVEVHNHRISGQDYVDNPVYKWSFIPANATKKIFVGQIPASRYMSVKVTNTGTGANLTNVFVGFELFKVT